MTETSGQPSAPADPSTPPAERPRHPVRELLGEAEFLKVWGIGALAGSMRWLEVLATGIYVYEVTGMAVVVSVILMARTLPMFVFGFVFGTAAERMDRRWMFRVAMVTMAVNTAGLAVLAWSGEIEVWHIFLGALINGIAWATDFPVRRTIIGFIAGEKRVGSAMSLDSATTNVTRMTGPMLGGLLYETIGLPGAFAVAAGCYGICAVIAMLTHGGAGEGARSKASGEQEGFFASLKAGLSGLRGRDGLIAVLAVTVAMNLFGFPYAALIPALGEHRFQIDAFLTGVLMSAEGMGATIGAFVIAVVARPAWFRRVYFIGALTFLSSIMVMSQISSYSLALVVLILGGFGLAGFGSMQSTLVFLSAPPEARSRMMGLVSVCIGAAPLGLLHVGWLGDTFGTEIALMVTSGWGLVATLAIIALSSRRR